MYNREKVSQVPSSVREDVALTVSAFSDMTPIDVVKLWLGCPFNLNSVAQSSKYSVEELRKYLLIYQEILSVE